MAITIERVALNASLAVIAGGDVQTISALKLLYPTAKGKVG